MEFEVGVALRRDTPGPMTVDKWEQGLQRYRDFANPMPTSKHKLKHNHAQAPL